MMRVLCSYAIASPVWLASSVTGAQGPPLDDPLPDIPFGLTTLRLEDVSSTLVFPVDVADPGDGTGRGACS